MGCYEVSLGDTIGAGTPTLLEETVHAVTRTVPIEKLAAYFLFLYDLMRRRA